MRTREGEDAGMNDEMQKRAITILASGIAYLLASRFADRFLDEPEERGVQDDVKEALVKASFSLASTVIASVIIRRVVSSRWGA
ncbi:MAG: hypothetical protein M3274_07335 [Actinomycetota bacterium]|jgi:hypothetical protein|nr:hypothetical protein [Rubrobacter sp.]MDQ3892691.1 hypothetical protein [Actinomycetota bacterium]MDQ4001091.1 hypothetical protein [Actinomycetota bacterium]